MSTDEFVIRIKWDIYLIANMAPGRVLDTQEILPFTHKKSHIRVRYLLYTWNDVFRSKTRRQEGNILWVAFFLYPKQRKKYIWCYWIPRGDSNMRCLLLWVFTASSISSFLTSKSPGSMFCHSYHQAERRQAALQSILLYWPTWTEEKAPSVFPFTSFLEARIGVLTYSRGHFSLSHQNSKERDFFILVLVFFVNLSPMFLALRCQLLFLAVWSRSSLSS